MSGPRSYTISEAAGLTGLHGNTIRKRIKQGQLDASTHVGKFGEEYRITYEALVRAGLIPQDGPVRTGGAELVLEGELVGEGAEDPAPATDTGRTFPVPDQGSSETALAPAALTALNDLFQRHEQAIFRLGYLQAEVDRLKTVEEETRELREERRRQDDQLHALQISLAERERQASEAPQLRAALAQKEREIADKEREAVNANALRRELESTQTRVRELETVRHDLDDLKRSAHRQQELLRALEEKQARRPWWRIFG